MSRPAPAPAPSPLSPLSMNSADSFASRAYGGTPSDVPYSGGPYGAARPSPPGSQHPSNSTDMSRPSVSGSSVGGGRPPSSASSVGMRSNDGRMGFGARPESGRSTFRPENEDALQRHYHVLKGYLASHLGDEKGGVKPNKARDKLLRLSVTQFMELSTDVYDELLRREDERTGRVPGVPRSLPPKQNFHPKRNQARQKLSTLPVERFRQLATDVFYELERRIPRFAGAEIGRPSSTTSNGRAPSRGGMRPPPPPGGFRGPPPNGGRPPMGPPPGMNGGYQTYRPQSPGPGMGGGPRAMSGGDQFGRPLPKTFQSNTIVPNKSTMVEDDGGDDGEDGFGGISPLSGEVVSPGGIVEAVGSEEDRERIKSLEGEIEELRGKIDELENLVVSKDQDAETLRGTLMEREEELARLKSSSDGHADERSQWNDLREELEQKHLDAQRLNSSLQAELDHLKRSRASDANTTRDAHDRELESLRSQLASSHRVTLDDLRAQLDDVHSQTSDLHRQLQSYQAENEDLRAQVQGAAPPDSYQREIEVLRHELEEQERITRDVQAEGMAYLREMRDLSAQNDAVLEDQEKLAERVRVLESRDEEWRQRYAKLKAQNRSLRASTMGLALNTQFDAGSFVRKEGLITSSGLVRDLDITRFQLSIDSLLKAARGTETEGMLDAVKAVTINVQIIKSSVIGEVADGYPTPSPSPLASGGEGLGEGAQRESVGRLKARVEGTAKSLITATKLHAASYGLSPVGLLDAAASNLTSAVVELVKAVGIRPSSKEELDSEVGDEVEPPMPLQLQKTMMTNDSTSSTSASALPQQTDTTSSHHQHHDSLASFYNDEDSNSSGTAAGLNGSAGKTVEMAEEPAAPPTKPLALNRSGTTKKVQGWFTGWGAGNANTPQEGQ